MRNRSIKIMLGTLAVSGVLGAGVAAAAGPPSWTAGNGPQGAPAVTAVHTGDQLRIRAQDGTGPRHDQLKNLTRQRLRDGTGPRHGQQAAQTGNRGATCPYRS